MSTVDDPVGRDDEVARLRATIDGAAASAGRFALVTGPAGIGKTTLLAAIGGYAAGLGIRVAWGFGYPGGLAPAFTPWRQVFRALDLSWPAAHDEASGPSAAQRFQLFDEVSAALLAESWMAPIVVLLDDLQYADASSIRLLDFLGRQLRSGALSVIATRRDGAAEPFPAQPVAWRN